MATVSVWLAFHFGHTQWGAIYIGIVIAGPVLRSLPILLMRINIYYDMHARQDLKIESACLWLEDVIKVIAGTPDKIFFIESACLRLEDVNSIQLMQAT